MSRQAFHYPYQINNVGRRNYGPQKGACRFNIFTFSIAIRLTDWRDRHKKQPPFLKVRGFLVKNFHLYLKSIPFKTKISFIILL